tara:strand:- start:16265 stop:18166 length:1902 start_codon:yes stop_codon:yes gene_type:complete
MSAFKSVYPSKNRIQHDGGKNNKFERSIIADNESPDCANVRFSNGGVGTRGGSSKLNTAAIGSFVGDGLYTRHASDGSQTMVAFAGGTMWTLGGTSFTAVASGTSVFTAGVRVSAVEYENHMFIGNGGVIPYKYNGSAFTRHGVYPPTATSTVASQATGVLTGDYIYKVTYRNAILAESDVGPVTATFAAASATARISAIPVAPTSFGVGSRRLYRTAAGGSTFKLVTTIADNTTTTFDDNVADASLGANAPTDNGVPPMYSIACYHQNRLFVNDPSQPNLIWYSELGEPYTFKSTNFIPMGDATSDLVKSIQVMENNLLVTCASTPFMVYMPTTDSSDWVVTRVQSPFGTKSPYGFFAFNKNIMFPAVQNEKFVGFAAINGIGIQPSATFLTVSTAGSLLQSEPIEPDMFLVQETYLGNISSIVFQNIAYIALTYDTGNTTNNRIYTYDFSIDNVSKKQKAAWSPDTGINPAQFTIYNGSLYFISSTATGFVYRYETTSYNDDGAAINSYFWTKEFSADNDDGGASFKDFRYVKALIDLAGAYFMNFVHRVDSDKGDGNTVAIDLDPGSNLWGTLVWGRDNWGGGQDQRDERIYLGSDRGERIQFKFSNQNRADQRFKSHGMKFYFNTKGWR